jgi:hypothetical protein
MSEVMAIESIAAEYAKFKGYFVEARVPFRTDTNKNTLSDIDVIGVKTTRNKKDIVIIECKAWGKANDYLDYGTPRRKERIKGLFRKMFRNWRKFKKNVEIKRWRDALQNLDALNFWLIIPGFLDITAKRELQKNIIKPVNAEIEIIPIHEMLLDILGEVRKEMRGRGKRYSDSALEFCRWLIRGYESGHLNLIDVDARLQGVKETYNLLRTNYFRDCLRIVRANAEKRSAGIDTRIKTLIALARCKRKPITIPELVKQSPKDYNLNNSRISVGLGTWERLGIITNDNGKYSIVKPFEEIVREELKKS